MIIINFPTYDVLMGDDETRKMVKDIRLYNVCFQDNLEQYLYVKITVLNVSIDFTNSTGFSISNEETDVLISNS